MKTSHLSKAYLKEVRQRCGEATPAPWISIVEGRDQDSGESFIERGSHGSEEDLYLHGGTIADQDFIAHSRQDIPILLGEIERLYKILEDRNQ